MPTVALEIEDGLHAQQEAPLTTLQRLKHSICPPSRSADPRCTSCASDALLELAGKPTVVDKLWTPLNALANNPTASLAGVASLSSRSSFSSACVEALVW